MKRDWKILILFVALVGAAFVVFLAPGIREIRQLRYPTPNSVSVFLKNYSQEPVLARFRWEESRSSTGGQGQSAGRLFITNRYDYRSDFALESAKQVPLMQALNDDIYAQLTHNGAVIIEHYGDPQKGFGFGYRIGKSVGTIILFPIKPSWSTHRATALPQGVSDMTVRISVTEKWFPYEFEAIQASKERDSHRPS